ncbi:MAG TPA: hypothetical protein PKU78_03930 [Candidatus Dojkabacteria bacterium]|nr:hypothetical protein [Candidatus Dojkabacteria bacterium]HRO65343.1 hypothetical protein [Candidatus Dojkabacteria bacterium]HRP50825.1 hypothetical protein [Candidatus Dojkabacteria bacterium]
MDSPTQIESNGSKSEDELLAEELDINLIELNLAQNFYKGLQTPPTRDEMKLLLTHYSVARNQEKQGAPGVSIPYALETSMRDTYFLDNSKLGYERPESHTRTLPKSKMRINQEKEDRAVSVNLATNYPARVLPIHLINFINNYFNYVGITEKARNIDISPLAEVQKYLSRGNNLESAINDVIETVLLELPKSNNKPVQIEDDLTPYEKMKLIEKAFENFKEERKKVGLREKYLQHLKSGDSMESALKKTFGN